MARFVRFSKTAVAAGALLALAACENWGFDEFDIDMRSSGGQFDTSDAARNITGPRPQPDDRGVISYPTYQVALARRGDTARDVALRVGLPPEELARFNGVPVDVPLRDGELLALPQRVAEPSPATGAISTGPIRPGGVDITTLAGNAIERSELNPAQAASVASDEPVRHQVARGETAFSIARRYNVEVEALADWNGLGPELSLREGQYLLIPITVAPARASAAPAAPGQGSPTPEPPSAAAPLPAENPTPPPSPSPEPAAVLDDERTAASAGSVFRMPVSGSIVRDYDGDDFTGIGIAADAGAPVTAAGDGSVLLITRDTNQNAILVLSHDDDLMTVYSGIDRIAVERGDTVRQGQQVAVVRQGDPSSLFFQVRRGQETFDPLPYLQ